MPVSTGAHLPIDEMRPLRIQRSNRDSSDEYSISWSFLNNKLMDCGPKFLAKRYFPIASRLCNPLLNSCLMVVPE